MEIFEGLIEELNQIVLTAKKAPLNSQDIVLNKAKMISVVEKLKANFPPEFREASKIVRERDYILQSAKTYAENIMDEATARAQQAIGESDIVQKSQEKANAIMKEAEAYYTKLEYEARLVSYNILRDVNTQLTNGVDIVRSKMQELQQPTTSNIMRQ